VSEWQAQRRSGLLYGLAAYGLWGVMPLYFRALKHVGPLEQLGHRIVWSALLLVVLVSLLGRWGDVAGCLRRGRTLALLLGSTLMIAVNWFVFIYGVATDQVLQCSLGYFLNPLLSIALGVGFFRERLSARQWAALALAAAGVGFLVWWRGHLPWIALVIPVSFGLYGVLRKLAPVDGLVGLLVETAFLTPPAAGFLAVWWLNGTATLGTLGWWTDTLLLLSGVVTAVPLMCFGQAARRLPLSTLGFLQYIGPSLQVVIATTVFGEEFGTDRLVAFGCTWAALALVSADSLAQRRREAAEAGKASGASPVPAEMD
jgi:chloramphenicol-sensitive protein RarD